MPGPGAHTVLISWPQFNPSPGLPGLPAHPPRGPTGGLEPTLLAKPGGPWDPHSPQAPPLRLIFQHVPGPPRDPHTVT